MGFFGTVNHKQRELGLAAGTGKFTNKFTDPKLPGK